MTFIPLDRVHDSSSVTATTTITVTPATPTVRVTGGGSYDDLPHAAAATVAGVAGAPGPSLEGVGPAELPRGPHGVGPGPGRPAGGCCPGPIRSWLRSPGCGLYGRLEPPRHLRGRPGPHHGDAGDLGGLDGLRSADYPGGGGGRERSRRRDSHRHGHLLRRGSKARRGGARRSGRATLDVDGLGLGGHSITAVYGGDALRSGARSVVVAESVVPASTRITLIPSGVLKGKEGRGAEPHRRGRAAIARRGRADRSRHLQGEEESPGDGGAGRRPGDADIGAPGVLRKPISVTYGGGDGFLASSAAVLR